MISFSLEMFMSTTRKTSFWNIWKFRNICNLKDIWFTILQFKNKPYTTFTRIESNFLSDNKQIKNNKHIKNLIIPRGYYFLKLHVSTRLISYIKPNSPLWIFKNKSIFKIGQELRQNSYCWGSLELIKILFFWYDFHYLRAFMYQHIKAQRNCNKSQFSNTYISTTLLCKPLIFQTSSVWYNRNHSLKYLRSTTFG